MIARDDAVSLLSTSPPVVIDVLENDASIPSGAELFFLPYPMRILPKEELVVSMEIPCRLFIHPQSVHCLLGM